MKDYESICFKIINSHYLKFISVKEKEKNKAKNAHSNLYSAPCKSFATEI